ncbi:MAG TPA: hypothetical protein VEA58_10625 [Anaerovoracaceae bacterium]|nr:hypothetical protein [Anaerovoracaceae bacterium]
MEITDEDADSVFNSIEASTVLTDTLPAITVLKAQDVKGSNEKGLKEQNVVQLDHIITNFPGACTLPRRIADLNGGMDMRIYKFDKKMNAQASYMGFTGSITGKQMLFVQDFIRYGYVKCGDTTRKVGIGLRCYIHVKERQGKAGYSSLPGIAANVELGKSETQYHLKTLGFGIDGRDLAEGLNAEGNYNVENFGKLAATFNIVLRKLNADNTMEITPVELP